MQRTKAQMGVLELSKATSSELCKLPNIGKTLEKRLSSVGINNTEELKESGSKEIFIRLYLHEGDTCLSTFCALEGAIQGIRWHNLSEDKKKELKADYESIKKK